MNFRQIFSSFLILALFLSCQSSEMTRSYSNYASGISPLPIPDEKVKTGVIFYPGGNVDEHAYLPLIHRLSQAGIPSIIVPMPFDLAVFGQKRAVRVIQEFPQVEQWVIMGHSLGGVMAARFASANPELISGIVFLASYPDNKNSLVNTNFKIISIYASEDGLATLAEVEEYKILLPESTLYYQIEGGNHAQFGDYGKQKGDNPALITRDEQMDITAEQILLFIENLD